MDRRWTVALIALSLTALALSIRVLQQPHAGSIIAAAPNGVAAWQATAVAALVALRYRIRPSFLSPTWLVAGSLTATAILGYYLQPRVADQGGAGIRLALTGSAATATTHLFTAAVVCLVAGAWLLPRRGLTAVRPALTGLRPNRRTRTWLFVLAIAPLPMVAATQNFHTLLDRSVYLQAQAGTNLAALGSQLAIPAVIVLGLLWADCRWPGRVVIVVAFASYLTLFFALGTRRFALVPVLFALGLLAANPTRLTKTLVAVSAALSLYLLPLPLYLRNQTRHGLYPYLQALPHYSFDGHLWGEITNNILVSFPITGATAYLAPTEPVSWFWIQLNPLPGLATGWYSIIDQVMLNDVTPYSGLGMLRNYGWAFLVGYCVLVGAFLAYLDRRVVQLLQQGVGVAALCILGLSALLAMYLMQYTLRTCTRMLLYAALVDLAARLWIRVRRAPPDDEPDRQRDDRDVDEPRPALVT